MVEGDGKKDMDMYKYYSPSSGTEAWVHASAPQTAWFTTGRTEVTPTANDQPFLPSPSYFPSILVTWLPPQNAGFGAVDPGQYIIICLRHYRSSGAGSWKGRGRRMAVEREGPAWEGGPAPPSNTSISLIFWRNWCNSCNSKIVTCNLVIRSSPPPKKKTIPNPDISCKWCANICICSYAFGDCVQEWLHSLKKIICQCWRVFGMYSSILNPSNWSTFL